LLSGGLLILAFEVYLQHFEKLSEIKIMWTPVIFGVVGGLLGVFISIFFNTISYYLFVVIMGVSMVVGSMGLYFHNKWRIPLILSSLADKEPVSIEFLVVNPPLLAPSAFVGLGVIGLLLAFYQPWNKAS